MNWSNGAVANSRHSPSGADGRRARIRQRAVRPSQPLAEAVADPKKPWLYQKNPKIVVSTIAATAISSRVRSSCRCSTSDMVPSGLTRDATSARIEFLEESGGLHGLASGAA